jgi:hypothetical protein
MHHPSLVHRLQALQQALHHNLYFQ